MSAAPADAKPAKRPPGWGIAAAVLAVVAAVVIVVASQTGAPHETDRDPLALTNDRELRAVTEAVSGIIRADGDDAEERAIAALEALHPESPGAADLRESCVTTYRGTHDAQRLSAQMHALLPRDGGGLTPEVQSRIQEMLDRSQRLVVEARESHVRCVALYEQAAQRLHIPTATRQR